MHAKCCVMFSFHLDSMDSRYLDICCYNSGTQNSCETRAVTCIDPLRYFCYIHVGVGRVIASESVSSLLVKILALE